MVANKESLPLIEMAEKDSGSKEMAHPAISTFSAVEAAKHVLYARTKPYRAVLYCNTAIRCVLQMISGKKYDIISRYYDDTFVNLPVQFINSDVKRMLGEIKATRDFSTIPVLADALEEAGWHGEDLNNLRKCQIGLSHGVFHNATR